MGQLVKVKFQRHAKTVGEFARELNSIPISQVTMAYLRESRLLAFYLSSEPGTIKNSEIRKSWATISLLAQRMAFEGYGMPREIDAKMDD